MVVSIKPDWRVASVLGVAIGAAAGWTGSYFRSRKMISELLAVIEEYQSIEENIEEFRKKTDQLAEAIRERTAKAQEVVDLINDFSNVEAVQKAEDVFNAVDAAPVIRSIFPDEPSPEWDQEAENAARQHYPGRPYIISVEEFQANDFDFSQQTVTFYEGDGVLVDMHDTPNYDPGNTVGVLLFGKGSGDPNICYVRNKKMKTEYEVIRDEGHYAQEQLGLHYEELDEDELKHSIRRFRPED